MELNINPKVIASWVGHKDGGVLILQRYSHVRPAHAAEMAEKVTFSNPEPQAVVVWQTKWPFHAPLLRGFFVSSNSERIFGIALKKVVHVFTRYKHTAKLCASAQVASFNLAADRFFAHSQSNGCLGNGIGGGDDLIIQHISGFSAWFPLSQVQLHMKLKINADKGYAGNANAW